MCDFRNINKIKILDTEEVIDVFKSCSWIDWADYKNLNFPHPGFFHVVATGSFSVYWDGEKILREEADYDVVDWSEYKPIFTRVEFKYEE
jgi:hypothetical protein